MTEDTASLAALRVAIATRNDKAASNAKVEKLHFDEGDLRVMVETKKCQVPGVRFDNSRNRWLVEWREQATYMNKFFPVKTFMVDGVTETEASFAAVQAAINFRARKFGLQNLGRMKMIRVIEEA